MLREIVSKPGRLGDGPTPTDKKSRLAAPTWRCEDRVWRSLRVIKPIAQAFEVSTATAERDWMIRRPNILSDKPLDAAVERCTWDRGGPSDVHVDSNVELDPDRLSALIERRHVY